MSETEIRPVITARERAAFIKMPWTIYADDPCWVPPIIAEQKAFLSPSRGPFFRHGQAQLWLAVRNGQPVGRISAHTSSRYDAIYGPEKGFFGFFECEDDVSTARQLFHTAESYLRGLGKQIIEGPFSFTVYDEIGVLVEGFERMAAIMLPHNPAYYSCLLEACGYEKSVDWFAFLARRGRTDLALPERLELLSDRIQRRPGIHFRQIRLDRFRQDAEHIKQLFDVAWDKNWGHVPMSDEEFWRIARGLKLLIIPQLSFLAEMDGEPVGFAISIYDINPLLKKMNGRLFPFGFWHLLRGRKKVPRFRMLLMGIHRNYRGLGLEVAFYVKTIQQAMRMHFQEAELSVIVETNQPMLKSIEYLDTDRYKTYRIYHKRL